MRIFQVIKLCSKNIEANAGIEFETKQVSLLKVESKRIGNVFSEQGEPEWALKMNARLIKKNV